MNFPRTAALVGLAWCLACALSAAQPRSVRVVDIRDKAYRPWSVFLRGGLAMPVGDLANYARGGATGGLEGDYAINRRVRLGLGYDYFNLPYKNVGSSSPFSAQAFSAKVRLTPWSWGDVRAGIGGGIGAWLVTHAVVDPYSPAYKFIAQSQSDAAFGFSGRIFADYEIFPQVSVDLDLALHALSLGGGTGDAIQLAALTTGLRFDF